MTILMMEIPLYLIKFDLRRNNKSKMNLKVIYHLIISIIKKIVFKLT